ncbi:3D-(3,5/4)-trihydroxycyclohexane-1,2-dione acylhydrolase (decyclizing) [Belliella aquatica]|uniref:3D-(3,5/4)-trihydroxycyclohexane-1,2-dione acylhydrolase (Decyclizing) n=1 Tax=Belliella aquatica TaxID=1323734 RepID=A0ABQ1LZV2_9BACT|nr:3D-(3,5/4)-trihydroxycyclohexane-1,2-dione acylhydrolase (decyclizing) [Belliella aquatica]MCH7406883.1 3D-(3,5/4)-trihydroxycyclohexane-1,2-dione acylhydrolase (decyclizing) [Belliella aquatica]GGC31989.1 3D-(3,5/4)-trihydroxycyclohexane-1,2-dione acylhydrolase (decyclizing) [Belliella aquatica]
MNTIKLTVAQALIRFLTMQKVERDGVVQPFFAGCFGIFGHGNVGGIGQALHQMPDFKFYQSRNEQAMVHTAAAFAKMKNRLSTFACTSSIGPGATNMITAAAGATINRIPVLLLPGDIFSTRKVDPVLQQLEASYTQDISVNDCFKPISKYWDRINRPEQLINSLPAAMRVLTSQDETGAVTICLPQDVQAESFEFPESFFEEKIWYIPRPVPEFELLKRAAELIRNSKKPMIIAGGGVIYSEATDELKSFIEQTGIPVGETFAGKGALPFDHPLNLGATGATGTKGANVHSTEADLIIGIGTRYSDFTTASKTAFQNKEVKFININIAAFDAFKHGALSLTGDARATLEALSKLLEGFETDIFYRNKAAEFNISWDEKVSEAYLPNSEGLMYQSEVIGAVNDFSDPKDVVLCAAGSLPGDLHKLWRTRDPKGFHLEYGFSCMGYEIAGGLGAKMACPDREIYVMVGDGSYLMMGTEIVTSIQEGYKLTIILINNNGYASIGGLSKSLGTEGFGTSYQYRNPETGQLDGGFLPVDLAENVRSLGAELIKAENNHSLKDALKQAKEYSKTTVIYVETKPERKLAGYGHAWWEVPVSEVSEKDSVKDAFGKMKENQKKQRYFN